MEEGVADIRQFLDSGANNVQIDYYIQLASEKDPTEFSVSQPNCCSQNICCSSASRIRSARKQIPRNRYGAGW